VLRDGAGRLAALHGLEAVMLKQPLEANAANVSAGVVELLVKESVNASGVRQRG
jgi:hypothetical protein